MAIKNTKLGGTDFVTPTDRVKPTDLNDTLNAIPTVVGVDLVGGSNSTASYVKIGEASVPAGFVNKYILVKSLYIAKAGNDDGGSPGDANADMDIRIGESSLEVSKQELELFNVIESSGNIWNGQYSSNIEYYYEPTTDEKTNGFNVQIFGKGGTSSAASASVSVIQLIIMGA